MDDKFIYYLIIGAIYLISRVLKKKKPESVQPSEPSSDSQEEPSQRPVSFEDLLKEITKEHRPVEKTDSEVFTYDEPVEKTIPSVKEITTEEIYVKKRHQELEDNRKLKIKQLLAEQEVEHGSHKVLELLEEEGGAANAIILSEILNRRY